MTDKIRVLVFATDDYWIVQGVDVDICAQSWRSEEHAKQRFDDTFNLEVSERNGRQVLKFLMEKPPPEFAERWRAALEAPKPNCRAMHYDIYAGTFY